MPDDFNSNYVAEQAPEPQVKKNWAGQVVVAVLLGLLAFGIVTATTESPTEDDFSNVRSEDLVELLKSLDATNQRLDVQVDELTATRDDLLDTTKRTEAATQEARQRSDALSILSGTVAAEGPGIRIEVSDPDKTVDATAMLEVIEELRNSGAEVIAVNGTARIVSTSFILNTDTGLRIDGRSISAPYVIEAIGDPPTLAEASRFLGGLVETLESRGAEVRIVEENKITITALADVNELEYAQPDS